MLSRCFNDFTAVTNSLQWQHTGGLNVLLMGQPISICKLANGFL